MSKSKIHDFTALFSTADWTGVWREDRALFDQPVLDIHHGLYVSYFENDNASPVYDKNREFSRGGAGRLVIHAKKNSLSGASLKPGKFEIGLVRRRSQDADHLHRSRADRMGAVFPQCLRLALVLDLSSCPVERMKSCEKQFKQGVDSFIDTLGIRHSEGTRQGDWRALRGPVPASADLKRKMTAILERVVQSLDGS